MWDATRRLSWKGQKQHFCWQHCQSLYLVGRSMRDLIAFLFYFYFSYETLNAKYAMVQRNGWDNDIYKRCHLRWSVSWTFPLYSWCSWNGQSIVHCLCSTIFFLIIPNLLILSVVEAYLNSRLTYLVLFISHEIADNECIGSNEEHKVWSWCRKHKTLLFCGG